MTRPGILYGVGVGPGDPDLVTIKAAKTIAAADVVAYPQLDDQPSFARSIVAGHLGTQREFTIRVPMADEVRTTAAYDAAAAEIADMLDAGASVAVLCEGDALLFGSFIYLWHRLEDRYESEIIPGISSVMAGAARLQMPLAQGRGSLAVIPGTLDDATLERRIGDADAVVILKVGRHLQRLRAMIERLGRGGDAHYIERATLPNESRAPLAEAGDGPAPYFSMIVIAAPAGGAP